MGDKKKLLDLMRIVYFIIYPGSNITFGDKRKQTSQEMHSFGKDNHSIKSQKYIHTKCFI